MLVSSFSSAGVILVGFEGGDDGKVRFWGGGGHVC